MNVFFNNTNATTLAVTLATGAYQELVKLPKVKQGVINVWADEHGTERSNQLFYESRVLNIPLFIKGNTEADLLLKIEAFKAFLVAAAEFDLKVQALNRRYKLRYSEANNFNFNKTICAFTIVVFDDYPQLNTPY